MLSQRPEDPFHIVLGKNALAGFVSGVTTGIAVGPAENLKVVLQLRKSGDPINAWDLSKKIFGPVPQFMLIFGTACALEFSVIDHLKKTHGPFVSSAASAATGGCFLAMADHITARFQLAKDAGKPISVFQAAQNIVREGGVKALPLGASPMFVRELFFVLGVVYTGPYVGEKIMKQTDPESKLRSDFLGRFLTVATFSLLMVLL